MLVQLYKGKKDNKGKAVYVQEALQMITGPRLIEQTEFLRRLYDGIQSNRRALEGSEKNNEGLAHYVKEFEQQYNDEKGKLPAVIWSGTFSPTRAVKNFQESSGLLVLDFDHLGDRLEPLFLDLKAEPFVWFLFRSPSGDGLKVVCRIDDSHAHALNFRGLAQWMSDVHGVEVDESGKDVSRLCFLCHDDQAYHNFNALPFELDTDADAPPAPPTAAAPAPVKITKAQGAQLASMGDGADDFYTVLEFTNNIATYTDGQRNNYIYQFANNCNRKGFAESATLGFSIAHFSDKKASEVEATVKSAYKHNAAEFGKYARKAGAGSKKAFTRSAKPAAAAAPAAIGPEAPGVVTEAGDGPRYKQFWTEVKQQRGKGENATIEIKRIMDPVDFTDFLFDQGFHLIATDAEGYQLCHSNGKIIRPVLPHHIKQHCLQWCRTEQMKDIEKILRKQQKQLFAATELDALHYRTVEFKRDNEEASYFYFKNCWVAVSKEGITSHEYNELDAYIWAGNKKQHHYSRYLPQLDDPTAQHSDKPYISCEFARFVFLASWNPNGEEKDFDNETIAGRFLSFITSIGFLLDGYKHPADRKGIFAIDHKVGEAGQLLGRAGKSIISKACSFLKVTALINGKTFDPKYQFRFEPITIDAQIVNFNDMPKNFDVESIFEVIADDYTVNRRNNGFIKFPYENSPKVYLSTNFLPKGDGDSYTARMHIIEFSDYFNAKHTPYDEFGHGLFSKAWDQEEWNRFYNFLLYCVHAYKRHGLVAYPKPNLEMRRLMSEIPIEFLDWFDDIQNVPRDKRLKKLPLLEEYNKVHMQLFGKKISPNSFKKWVAQYCRNRGLFFNPHRNGDFDKAGGTEWYSLATSLDYKPGEVGQQAMAMPGA